MPGTSKPDVGDGFVGACLFRGGPVAVVVIDDGHRLRRVNPAAQELFGYAEAELVGTPLERLFSADEATGVHPPSRGSATPTQVLEPTGEAVCTNARRRDGSEVPVEVTVNWLGDGHPPWLCAVVRDVSDQVAREEALTRQRNLFHALSESNQLLVRSPAPDQVYSEICRIVVDYGGMALGWVGLVDEAGEVKPMARYGAAADYVDSIRVTTDPNDPEGRGPTGTAIRERRHVLNTRIQQDPAMAPWQEPAAERGLRSSGAFPIVRGGSVVGALNIYAGDPDFFAPSQVALFDELAADIGAALTHFDQQQENRRLREIIEASPDFIGTADAQGRLSYVNPAAKRAFGKGVASKSVDQLYSPESQRLILEEGIPTARREGLWQGEVAFYHSNGQAVPYSQVIVAHRDHKGEVRFFSTIARDISAFKAAQERIHELAYRSEVTGLLNRVGLRERLAQEVARLQRKGWMGAVIHLDLDGFKAINDSLGTAMGDALLWRLGERLTERVRAGDVVGHIGGDELVILALDIARDKESAALAAENLAEEVRARIAEPITCEGRSLRVTAGVGVTLFPADAEDPDRILEEADVAVDRAKEAGGDTVRFYESAMLAGVKHQLNLEQELHGALERGELHVVYQPLWDLAREQPVGLEALMRWEHPERGPISPGEFIPLAERRGLIRPIGDWILDEVLDQAGAWLRDGWAPLPLGIAVNVSPRQFAQKDWVERVRTRLAASELDPGYFKLEVTESLLMANLGNAKAKMTELRGEGVGFALDDFGTGYSSLAYLQELPLDWLKVDRSFVGRIGYSKESEGIIEAVLAMAGHLGLGVIAEGVETAGQVAFLRERGCEVGQGFYWARPLPPEEVAGLLPRA